MHNDKSIILKRLCFTELVYGRINKKLRCQLAKDEIEKFIFRVIEETDESLFERIGKNIYLTNQEKNIKITVNATTYRVITVDSIIKITNN